jgi:hypothetical protein
MPPTSEATEYVSVRRALYVPPAIRNTLTQQASKLT